MLNNLKDMILFCKYGYKATSDKYNKYLCKKGVKLGKNVTFYSPWTITVDTQRPWMIEIGNNVHITSGVTILQHGYDWCVLQKKYGEVLGSTGKVKIGDNVFIGVNTTILKGVTIGNDVIIGANSLVNKNCLAPGVYAGNPAKFIMSLEDYYNKRKEKQVEEAKELVIEYYKKYGEFPQKKILREYFWLFENKDSNLIDTFEAVHRLEGNYEFSTKIFRNHKSIYKNYDQFLKDCMKEIEKDV